MLPCSGGDTCVQRSGSNRDPTSERLVCQGRLHGQATGQPQNLAQITSFSSASNQTSKFLPIAKPGLMSQCCQDRFRAVKFIMRRINSGRHHDISLLPKCGIMGGAWAAPVSYLRVLRDLCERIFNFSNAQKSPASFHAALPCPGLERAGHWNRHLAAQWQTGKLKRKACSCVKERQNERKKPPQCRPLI